jgi:hypothetical protein
MTFRGKLLLLASAGVLGFSSQVMAQAEITGGGQLRGIRVDGELIAFASNIRIQNPDGAQFTGSGKAGGNGTRYSRDGNTVTVINSINYGTQPARGARAGGRGFVGPTTNPTTRGARGARGTRGGGGFGGAVSGFNFTETFTDTDPGTVKVTVQITDNSDTAARGPYFFLTLPGAEFSGGTAEWLGSFQPSKANLSTGSFLTDVTATGIRINSPHSHIELNFPKELDITIKHGLEGTNSDSDYLLQFPINSSATTRGQTSSIEFTVHVSQNKVDTAPVNVAVDPSNLGSKFYGIGGNYRIQGGQDQAHIQYILDHMRVAWGRVAMPWGQWQPDENSDPIPPAQGGQPAAAPGGGRGRGGGGGFGGVAQSMEMARTLAQKNIPMIISVWAPPQWALQDVPPNRYGGTPLDPTKYDQICKSIGSYLLYLRDHYGAEPKLFSFNESDFGINVLQTPQDHDEAIKRLGAYFQSIGLKTKMLLGDTADPTGNHFIDVAMNDPEAVKYIGAVSFHSWRGGTDEQYAYWGAAAKKLGVPMICAEGGTDSSSSSYPAIFLEQWYALDELSEYVRLLRITQAASILEWQLTQNYSVLTTDQNGDLIPAQRFYDLKQLDLAPAGSSKMPVRSDKSNLLACAFANPDSGNYIVNLVNNGPTRSVIVTGLLSSLKQMHVMVSDINRGMKELDPVTITNGTAHVSVDHQSFVTLFSGDLPK